MKNQSRQGKMWLLSGVVLIFMFTAFGLLAAGAFAAEKTTITVLSSDDFAAFRKAAIPDFEKANPDIKVNLISVGYDQLHDKIVTALAGGATGFDVIDVDEIWTAEFVEAGFLADVTDRVTAEMKKGIVPAGMNILTYQNRFWGLPMFVDTKFFYYNNDLLAKAGFKTPPQTWAEFVEQSKKLQEKKLVKYATIWGWGQHEGLICDVVSIFPAFGGRFIDPNGKFVVNNPDNVRALQFMVDLLYKYKAADPASITADDRSMLNSFIAGDVAFGLNWSFAWGIIDDPSQSKVAGKVRLALMPGEKKKSASGAGSMGLEIASGSRQKDAAWKFIAFLAERQQQKNQAINYGALPIWQSLYTDPEVQKKHPALAEMSSQLKYAVSRPRLTWYSEFSRVLQLEVHNALTQNKSPKQALDDAQKEIERLAKKYGNK